MGHDHQVSLGSDDLRRAEAFWHAVMAEPGWRRVKDGERTIADGLTDVRFSLEGAIDARAASVGNGRHVAFHAGHRRRPACRSRAWRLRCGRPGIHAAYDAPYYAVFWRHPVGNTIEIVAFSADKVEGRRAPGAKPELAMSFGGDDGWEPASPTLVWRINAAIKQD